MPWPLRGGSGSSTLMSKYELSKMSAPGWDKRFDTLEELKEELECWVCNLCFGEESTVVNPDTKEVMYTIPALTEEEMEDTDLIINREEYNNMSVKDQLNELLGSHCGAEFLVCENTEKALQNVT